METKKKAKTINYGIGAAVVVLHKVNTGKIISSA